MEFEKRKNITEQGAKACFKMVLFQVLVLKLPLLQGVRIWAEYFFGFKCGNTVVYDILQVVTTV